MRKEDTFEGSSIGPRALRSPKIVLMPFAAFIAIFTGGTRVLNKPPISGIATMALMGIAQVP